MSNTKPKEALKITLHFSACRRRDGGVGITLWSRARTCLRDHSSEEGEAVGETVTDDWGIPTLLGAHEEPVGHHRLDRRLESEVTRHLNISRSGNNTSHPHEG